VSRHACIKVAPIVRWMSQRLHFRFLIQHSAYCARSKRHSNHTGSLCSRAEITLLIGLCIPQYTILLPHRVMHHKHVRQRLVKEGIYESPRRFSTYKHISTSAINVYSYAGNTYIYSVARYQSPSSQRANLAPSFYSVLGAQYASLPHALPSPRLGREYSALQR
jgi:hypothetical protein